MPSLSKSSHAGGRWKNQSGSDVRECERTAAKHEELTTMLVMYTTSVKVSGGGQVVLARTTARSIFGLSRHRSSAVQGPPAPTRSNALPGIPRIRVRLAPSGGGAKETDHRRRGRGAGEPRASRGRRFVLEVNLRVFVQGIKLGEAEEVGAAVPQRGCPYSNAVRGNVPVTIAVFEGVAP
jgi:hypothetical protein